MSNKQADNRRSIPHADSYAKKSACVDVGRIFDSCSDRDCLEDLRVYFASDAQCIIDSAVCIRAKKAKVVGVTADLDELPFRDGCYSCKLQMYIQIQFEVYSDATDECCKTVCGLTMFEKSVVLYGGEGNVQVFSGEYSGSCGCHLELEGGSMPRCRVQVAEPVVLEATLADACGCHCVNWCGCRPIPACVLSRFGGNVTEVSGGKTVLVTLGVFTVVQMVRDVQMIVPYYGDCIPCKECNCNEETPCERFRRMSFPLEEFFPKPCKDKHA